MISRLNLYFINLLVIYQLYPSNLLSAQSFRPYIGIHGGINFSQPLLLGGNQQIVTLLNGEKPEKRIYNNVFKNTGYQIGFSFYLRTSEHISIGFLPEISTNSYGYSSHMTFYNNQGDSVLNVENISKSRINYFHFPIIFQYQQKFQKVSPYLFVGASYGLMRSAQHTVKTNSFQENNVGFSQSTTDNYSDEYIQSKFNILGGFGIIRDFTIFHLALDMSYWIGLHNIINESNRYNIQSIGGTTYDVPDDIKLNHFVLNISIIFPINKSVNRGSLDCIIQKKKN
jgi:hypothetical protein